MFCYARNNEADGTQEGAGLTKRIVTKYEKNIARSCRIRYRKAWLFVCSKCPIIILYIY
nr:MAG TPA: hypothetical protein [Caudoviricetes sp.]